MDRQDFEQKKAREVWQDTGLIFSTVFLGDRWSRDVSITTGLGPATGPVFRAIASTICAIRSPATSLRVGWDSSKLYIFLDIRTRGGLLRYTDTFCAGPPQTGRSADGSALATAARCCSLRTSQQNGSEEDVRTPCVCYFDHGRSGCQGALFACNQGKTWRRGRDSNPRGSCPPSGLANRRTRPLCDLSRRDDCIEACHEGSMAEGEGFEPPRLITWLFSRQLPSTARPSLHALTTF